VFHLFARLILLIADGLQIVELNVFLYQILIHNNHPYRMENQNVLVPRSLFSDFIMVLTTEDGQSYSRLKFNRIPIEWQDRYSSNISVERLTEKNWNKILIPKKTTVYIPISRIEMHHKIIEREGHDRILELTYIQQTGIEDVLRMAGDEPVAHQLTFRVNQPNPRILYASIRSDRISEYPYPIMVKHSQENATRFRIRDSMLQWYYSE
jgi:hypothetical protein